MGFEASMKGLGKIYVPLKTNATQNIWAFSSGPLLGNYPVMDLEEVKRTLLAGKYESSVTAAPEELARATIKEAELIYSTQSWQRSFVPVYRLYLRMKGFAMRTSS